MKTNTPRPQKPTPIRRADYDVGFVYYAGHAVQIEGQNYLLPTKVDFQKETDVRIKALNVQHIMSYLRGVSDEVNILVLDACRDNPFEEKQTTSKSLRQFKLSAESIAVLDRIRKTNKATNSEIIEQLLLKAGQNLVRGE